MSEHLTADERAAFLDVLRDVEHVGLQTGTWEQGRVLDAVERIIADRLDGVEHVLARHWDWKAGRSLHAAVSAALHGDRQ